MRSFWLQNGLLFCFLWKIGDAAKQPDPRVLDKRGVTGLAIFTGLFLVLVLCFSLFGKRMKSSGIRWFTINLCLWGLLHMLYITAWRDKDSLLVQALPAWPDWIECKLCYQERWTLESFQKSVFPFGIVFIMLERAVLMLAPKVEDNRAFQLLFAVIFLIFQNMFFVGMWFYQLAWRNCKETADNWMKEDTPPPTCLFFDPAELFHMISYVVYVAANVFFLIFCCIGSYIFCVTVSFQETKRASCSFFRDMWLAWVAASFPHFLHAFLFGSAVVNMIVNAFMTEVLTSPFASYFGFPTPAPPTTSPPPPSNVTHAPATPGPPPESPPPPLFSMPSFEQIMFMVGQITAVVPWMVTILPLFEVLLIVLCFRMYREQLFSFLSCGRIFSTKTKKVYLQHPPLKHARLSLIPSCEPPVVVYPSAPPPDGSLSERGDPTPTLHEQSSTKLDQ